MKKKRMWLVLFMVLGGLFLFWTYLMINGKLLAFDLSIIAFVQGQISPFHSKVMLAFTNIGSTLGITIILTVIVFSLFFMKYQAFSIYLALVSTFSSLLNTLLKEWIERPRPTIMPLLYEGTFSYPSGHAMAATSLFLSLSYVIFQLSKNSNIRIIWLAFAAMMIFAIGLSRIYFGVHYPTDILAGYMCGAIWGIISTALFRKLEKRFT